MTAAAPRPRGGGANPREDCRLAAALWIDGAAIDVPLGADVEHRAAELATLGFAPLDALHIAFAERADARWFVTCDDAVIRRAHRHEDVLGTRVVSPVAMPRDEP